MSITTYTVVDGELLSENRNGTERQYVPDAQGNTIALLDTSGAIAKAFSYWSYGSLESGDAATTKYLHGGTYGIRRQSNGDYYARFRIEDPLDGKWFTVDPLWPRDAPYTFVGANPSSFIDPMGLLKTINCPTHIDKWLNKMCSNLDKISSSILEQVNNCIAVNNPGCPEISSTQLSCMKDYCKTKDVRCYEGGRTPRGGSNIAGLCWWGIFGWHGPYIDLSTTVPGSNKHNDIFSPVIVNVGDSKYNLLPIGLTLLHELGHACGVDHGDNPKNWQCNDVVATCIYLYFWR